MTKAKPRPKFPDRKISETFLHFAEPLLEPLGPHATEEQENQALKIAFTVWNAVVYESANGDVEGHGAMPLLRPSWRGRAICDQSRSGTAGHSPVLGPLTADD